MDIILASSSTYRKTLLNKLALPYRSISPNIDESLKPNESPEQLVKRLAEEKAAVIAAQNPQATVIGSDQMAVFNNQPVGKPLTTEKAIKQLMQFSGKRITFLTSLCVINQRKNIHEAVVEPFHVHFRTLDQQKIERYIEKEKPLDCAGSFKAEGLGIALFSKLEGNDPNALIGLPLIQLVSLLNLAGIEIP